MEISTESTTPESNVSTAPIANEPFTIGGALMRYFGGEVSTESLETKIAAAHTGGSKSTKRVAGTANQKATRRRFRRANRTKHRNRKSRKHKTVT